MVFLECPVIHLEIEHRFAPRITAAKSNKESTMANHKLYGTMNDLPEQVRVKVEVLLNERLADITDLKMQSKQAHWNVKGPHFYALHKLFDEIVEALEDYEDDVAERSVQLGGIAKGTVQAVAEHTSLKPYSLNLSAGEDHLKALGSAIAHVGARVRSAIDQSEEYGDKDTADLFTEISRGLDKWLWFVEAHLQAEQ
jgi:starvation-inducible DNA-binding protein